MAMDPDLLDPGERALAKRRSREEDERALASGEKSSEPFVFPAEFDRLMRADAVPLAWREIHAVAAFTYLRPGELRVLRWSDVDLEHGLIAVTRAWDSRELHEKAPKTRTGVRQIPIAASLAPLLARRRAAADESALVVPLLAATPEDDVAEMTRGHLRAAGIARPALFVDTATTVRANFRSWRDSGITWLALSGLDVAKIQRRAGHETISTTLGYVKQAEDFAGNLGEPFAPLPACVIGAGRAKWRAKLATPPRIPPSSLAEYQRRGRDSNPRRGFIPEPA